VDLIPKEMRKGQTERKVMGGSEASLQPELDWHASRVEEAKQEAAATIIKSFSSMKHSLGLLVWNKGRMHTV